MAASSLSLTTPLAIGAVNTMHPDFALGSFFVAGLYVALLYSRTHRFPYLVILLAILGMLLGVKTSGGLYGSIIVVFVIASTIRRTLLRQKLADSPPRVNPSALLLCALGLLSFLVVGCFWYLRNLVDLGNPLGFVRVTIGNFTLFPGPIDTAYIRKTTLSSLFGLTNPSHWKILINEIITNLSLPFVTMVAQVILALFVLPLAPAAGTRLSAQVHAGAPRIKTRYWIGLLVVLATTAFLYWTTPYSGDNGTHDWQITPWIGQGFRYAFPLMGVLGILAALSGSLIRNKEHVVVSVVIASSVFSVINLVNQRLVYIYLFTVVGLLLVWSMLNTTGWTKQFAKLRGVPKLGFVLMLVGFFFAATIGARVVRDRYRTLLYNGIIEYIENNVNREQTIGYLLNHRPYLLYGKHLDRKVSYVAPEAEQESQWLQTLEKRHVSFVAIGPIIDAWKSKQELSWIRNNEKTFVHVFGGDSSVQTVIYRFMGHE